VTKLGQFPKLFILLLVRDFIDFWVWKIFFLGMATFAGTTQKCKACEKTVYLVEQLTADSKVYHKALLQMPPLQGYP
jgi:hypothetical protein